MIAGAGEWLAPGGALLVETSDGQAASALAAAMDTPGHDLTGPRGLPCPAAKPDKGEKKK